MNGHLDGIAHNHCMHDVPICMARDNIAGILSELGHLTIVCKGNCE